MIKEGDQVTVLIEANGPGGYYAEVMRNFVVGRKPSREMQDHLAIAVEAQGMNAKRMKSGADPKELWDMTKNFLAKNGYIPPVRLYIHGQGLPLAEGPAIRPEEPWSLKAGMNIAVHPYGVRKDIFLVLCDNNLIGEERAERIHKSPREIISI